MTAPARQPAEGAGPIFDGGRYVNAAPEDGAPQGLEKTRARPVERERSAAAERAYARRAQRRDRTAGPAPARRGQGFRAPFVLLLMALLSSGLIISLWLTTAAATDSVRLEQLKKAARDKSETVEALRREVRSREAMPEVANAAHDLGLVPASEPAIIVVRPDGTVEVIGEAKPVKPPSPDPPPAQAPAAATPDPAQQAGAVPADGAAQGAG